MEYNASAGFGQEVMFLFKSTTDNQNGKYLLSIGSEMEYNFIGITINNENKPSILLVSEYQNAYVKTVDESFVLDEWNFFSFSWMSLGNKMTIRMQLNNSLYEVVSNMSMNFSSLAFTNGQSASYLVSEYYRLTKYYIFDDAYNYYNDFFNISNTNHYNIDLLNEAINGYDVFPLNNSLISIAGTKPLAFTKRPKVKIDVDRTFEYNHAIKRYAYVADGQKLVYDFGLSKGSIALKVYITDTADCQYLFQNKDSNGKTLGLCRKNGELYLQIEEDENNNDVIYPTGITLPNNVWALISFSWSFYDDPSEQGVKYYFSLQRYYVDNEDGEEYDDYYSSELRLGFEYSECKTSVGRRMDPTATNSVDALLGQIEMLLYRRNNYIVYSRLKDEIKVTSYNKQFDVFDRITEANLAEDGQDILTYEYGYKKHQNNENRLTTQINKEIIKTKLETITREYTYDGTGNVGVVSENGIAKRFYYYDYSGQLEKEYICENDIYNTIYGIEYV